MKKTFLPILLISTIFAGAQKTKPPIDYKWAVSFSPFALAQIDYSVMAGLEYKLSPKTGLATDIAYVFASDYLDGGHSGTNANGFIFRPSARFYVTRRNNFYLQPQVFYKQVTHKDYGWIGKDCVLGVPSYQQLEEYRYRRSVYGFNAILGVLLPLSKKEKSFIDLYGGLGVRHKKAQLLHEANSCYLGGGIMDLGTQDANNGTFPSLPGGVKLVFVIN